MDIEHISIFPIMFYPEMIFLYCYLPKSSVAIVTTNVLERNWYSVGNKNLRFTEAFEKLEHLKIQG